MKKLLCLTLIVCLALVGVCFGAGKLVKDPNGAYLQAHSPYPAASACVTTTTTKGTITSATVAGYSQICWEASDSSNAAKRIKAHLNSNTAYLPATGRCFGLNSDITSVAFKPYSAQAAAYTVCYELQRGGKTP